MNRTFDRWGGFFFLVLGAAIVWQSFGISQSVSGSVVGPRRFPVGLGALLMLFSLRLIYETFTSPKYAESGAAAKPKETLNYRRFLLFVAVFLLYIALLKPLGYVLSTILYLTVAFQLVQRGKLWLSLLVAAAFAGVIYYVFVVVLKGTLPGFPSWLGG